MPNWTAVELEKGLVLFVEGEGEALRRATFGTDPAKPPKGWRAQDRDDKLPVLKQAAVELKQYWAGKRRAFSVQFELEGTEFQCRVWEALSYIPFGELRCYGDIAEAIGKPKAVRAVGAANGANPLPIFVPCHRVIGADGTLTGYAAGLDVKRALLAREGIEL
ncbi:MAG: methylated-DNA--[protein]-cysteine S-methyltransferase [Acidobacteria bacterium]|nr:methylated-DNA--[protein]-cysteine S-methyltransferase [Acidobacteriota bacterium]